MGSGWPETPPHEDGVDRDVLEAIADRVASGELVKLHAVVVMRGGRLIFERYFDGPDQDVMRLASADFDHALIQYRAGSLHDLRSVTKSVTSLLYGIALADGVVPAPNAAIFDAFPEHADLRTPEHDQIRVAHLLTMTMGIDWDESIPYTDERNSEIQMWIAPDAVGYVLSRPVIATPGASFVYNGGATQVLAALIEKGTGYLLDDYARQMLLTPLGIGEFHWARDRNGHPMAASGMRLRAVDLAKIAQLYLSGGRFEGRQVAPAEWLTECLRPRVEAAVIERARYGYQWWTSLSGRIAAAMGNGGQRAVLVPEADLVAAVLAGNYDDPANACSDRVIAEHVLPAVGLPAVDSWWTL